MCRLAAVMLTVAALLAGFVSAAEAATHTVAPTVAVDDATQNGVAAGSLTCTGTSVAPISQLHLAAAATAPDDTNSPVSQSWTSSAAVPVGDAWGLGTGTLTPAAQLGTLKVDVYNGPSGVVGMIAISVNTVAHTIRIFAGKAAIPAGATGAWATVDESSATYIWNEYNLTASPTAEPTFKASAGTSTLAAFDLAHSTTTNQYTPVLAFGCGGESFALQHLQWGTAGTATPNSLDLGLVTNTVSVAPSASFVSAGAAVTVNGFAQYGSASTALLSFKDLSVGTYSTASRSVFSTVIDQLRCTADRSICNNPFTAVIAHPLHNTIYKWSYAGGPGVEPASSAFVMVHVQTRLMPAWPAATQYVGRAFAMNGTSVPLKVGSRITLWGRNGASVQNFGIEPIGPDGTWRRSVKVFRAGTWTFWYTIGNDSTNAASKSAAKGIVVR